MSNKPEKPYLLGDYKKFKQKELTPAAVISCIKEIEAEILKEIEANGHSPSDFDFECVFKDHHHPDSEKDVHYSEREKSVAVKATVKMEFYNSEKTPREWVDGQLVGGWVHTLKDEYK